MEYEPETVARVAECPREVVHDGRAYSWTGKIGQRISDPDVWVVELEAEDHGRVWVDARGNVYPE